MNRPRAMVLAAVLAQDLPPPSPRKVDFASDVAPIFERACLSCHGPDRQRSDYRLDVEESALHGGQIGGAIVPGRSGESALVRYVAGVDETIRMPARGEMLSDDEVGILRRWIDDGADWPDAPVVERPDHWAYQPIAKAAVPDVRAADRVRTPVDAFVLAKLESRGLRFAAPAERATLLRRVTFDLTGLPPTPEEVAAFGADESAGAYERVVDRLLASARYGERWARRWIDLVHFAETHGNDQDRPRPHAWPYRDWLVESFNADKPYALFVQEQLAADALFPDDPSAVRALGFLAAGPWDESSQLNIVDDTVDKQIARNLDRDDMLTTTMSTFASTTIHCARCHNHKFDPIPQTEYYELQSVFAGVDRANRPFDLDPKLHGVRQGLLRRKLALERAPADSPQLLDPALAKDIAAWEQALGTLGPPWIPLTPLSVVSAGGSTATVQSDGSVLFSGERPETDTTTITVRVDLASVTALRLDVLPDETLPFRGPGRQDNGNLHLSELTLAAATSPLALPSPLPLIEASADFDQDGWTSAMAIDGKPETAWGIWPQIGRAHHAVFELKEPFAPAPEGGDLLTITLAQLHGRQHLIGKLRLAVTSAPRPVRATRLPEPIAKILAVAPDQRSAAQAAELGRYVLLKEIDDEIAALPPPQVVFAGATDFVPENNFIPARGPRPIHVLARGDVTKPGAPVTPGALSCLEVVGGFPRTLGVEVAEFDDESARRAALARWITDPRNALAWRSIVNRAWQAHFSRGIVATPSDFGAMGSAPSHNELLDWLASWFLERGGSLKELDRLLVTSEVYRQSTDFDPQAAACDADNVLLWRMNRTRLDAESIRDAVLQIAGKLDLTMGGPSVKQFVESPGIHVTPNVDYETFDVDSPASCRRSIYRFLFRTLPDPLMETLDCPDASQLAPTRASSVTPLQALSLLNNRFIVRMSEHVAARSASVDELFHLVLLRAPSPGERAELASFAEAHGLANAARLLLNSNEFVFVD